MKQSRGFIYLRMSWKSISTISIIGLVACAIVLAYRVPLPVSAAGPWYVSPGGSDSNDCLSPASPCGTINGAIDKAFTEDTIYIAEGIYIGFGEEVVLADKDLQLSGGWNSTFTAQNSTSTIDGQGGPRGLTVSSDMKVSMDHVNIQNGGNSYGGLGGMGGGIINGGTLTITYSTISGNSSYYGGGIYNGGALTLINSNVSENFAEYGTGGGIANIGEGKLTIVNSTINDNTTQLASGGGIFNSGTLTITNSTISGNWAQRDNGGGISNMGALNMNNSTVTKNIASLIFPFEGLGGGIYNIGTTTLQNTIVAGNTGTNGLDCSGSISSAGYNLIGNTSGCTFSASTGDLLNTAPRLFSLIGSPGYHPLLRDSPAIDAGNPSGCTDQVGSPLETDQRGVARVGRCDIGSYEYDPANDPLKYVSLPLVFRNSCPNFFDDFSNPASGWTTGENAYVRSEYLNSEYRVLSKRAGYYYLFRSPSCYRQDYVVEVDARWVGTPGASYGLMFGITGDFDQFYLFIINTDHQEYALLGFDPAGAYNIVEWTPSTAIHSGTASNHLKVTRDGAQITLEVNGVGLGTWSDSHITGLTGAGLVTNPYNNIPASDARFDNFSFSKLNSAATEATMQNGNTGTARPQSDFRMRENAGLAELER